MGVILLQGFSTFLSSTQGGAKQKQRHCFESVPLDQSEPSILEPLDDVDRER
jgi:hypothetical protein